MSSDLFDVAVCGAGPAGSIAALQLARRGARVLLIDRARFPRDKPCAEFLSPEVNVLFDTLGLGQTIDDLGAKRLSGFRVFTPTGAAFTGQFGATTSQKERRSYGLSIPRRVLDSALLDAAIQAGATFRDATRVLNVENMHDRVDLDVASNQRQSRIGARFVVAADGIHSVIARRLQLSVQRHPRRVAFVAHMTGIDGLDELGEMHTSSSSGYCGLAAFADGSAGVSMVVDEQTVRGKSRSKEELLRSFATTYPVLAGRLRHATLCREVLVTSGLSQHVHSKVSGRIVLAGDAAGYYDPFTGEGVYRAIAMGDLAGRHIANALKDTSHAPSLQAYERQVSHLFKGKELVERLVDVIVHQPKLLEHVAHRLRKNSSLADTLVGVTGDYIAPWTVLRPGYLARLVA